MATDREAAIQRVEDALLQLVAHAQLRRAYAEAAVDALAPAPPPGDEGEAVERVRAALAEWTDRERGDLIVQFGKWRDGRNGSRHYVPTSALCAADLRTLLAAVSRLSPGEVEWGVRVTRDADGESYIRTEDSEEAAREACDGWHAGGNTWAPVLRVCGPWQPAPAGGDA